jgi:hypothetical protein
MNCWPQKDHILGYEEFCEICGEDVDNCSCPECSECGEINCSSHNQIHQTETKDQ